MSFLSTLFLRGTQSKELNRIIRLLWTIKELKFCKTKESELYACHFAVENPHDYIHFSDSKYCIIKHTRKTQRRGDLIYKAVENKKRQNKLGIARPSPLW
jgi:hypothetical protein